MRRRAIVALGLLAAFASDAAAQENIGVAALVQERATGALATQERVLARGDRLFRNENVSTGAGSALHVLFLDQTTLSLGPDTTIMLDEFVYDPSGSTGRMVATLGTGITRIVTGVLPKDGYEIRTPTASIGVRGTVFDVAVDRNGETTVVLRSGEVTVRPRLPAGAVTPAPMRLSTPGLAVTVARDRLPTPPGAVPPNVARALALLPAAPGEAIGPRPPNGPNQGQGQPQNQNAGPPPGRPPLPPRVLAGTQHNIQHLKPKCPPPGTPNHPPGCI